MIPGEILCDAEPIALFDGTAVAEMTVTNAGDRPIQVGSHYHFAEANPALRFDRVAARGKRLAIPAGTSVRFEPGIARTVGLLDLGGRRRVLGLRGQVAGPLGEPAGTEPTNASADVEEFATGAPGGESLQLPTERLERGA